MNTIDDFYHKFKPMLDHAGRIKKFACEGGDLNMVRQMEPKSVWTIVDHYNGTWILEPGYKRAGRLYFVICENSFDEDEVYSEDWVDIVWHTETQTENIKLVDAV